MKRLNRNPLEIRLPKWPALTVVGERVTPDQAAEIIIRTDSWHFGCNDQDLTRQLRRAAGLSPEGSRVSDCKEFLKDMDHDDLVKSRYRVLNIEYLHNARIVSSYIDGPHGWCDWYGRIECSSYNIGKWPDAETVFEEWLLIARAFPFLRLRSQLYNVETSEPGEPVVEYAVWDGNVEAKIPEYELKRREDFSANSAYALIFTPPGIRESGCSIQQFERALELAEKGDDE